MARNRNNNYNYNPKFIEYMHQIINHPNYKRLPIRFKNDGTPVWVATKKSKADDTGIRREQWADEEAVRLGFENSSKKYADTMFVIHPTKKKVCQWCGKSMDLHYIYPTKNTVKYFEKHFHYIFDKYDSIYDIVIHLPQHENEIKTYLINKAKLSKDFLDRSIIEVIVETEYQCRMGGKSIFSPGAMSNFPDRFDGFHSYNLCCRKEKDTGRHDDNMATYNKDRRAYEYWSDGNIVAANQIMPDFSVSKGLSADHIGPISLGFIHDPLYLQPMRTNDNSAKRDRLYDDDLDKLILIENTSGVSPASSFASKIWKYIKADYQSERRYHTLEWYRDILKQNMLNYMESLWILRNTKNRPEIDNFFRINHFQPKYDLYFKYRYEFDENGNITAKTERNVTGSAKLEFERFVRISFESVDDFHEKSDQNRKGAHDISGFLLQSLIQLRNNIELNLFENARLLSEWNTYLDKMQDELLSDWLE